MKSVIKLVTIIYLRKCGWWYVQNQITFFILPHKLEYIRENNAKTPTHYKTIMFG